jgi:hypothetical protein
MLRLRYSKLEYLLIRAAGIRSVSNSHDWLATQAERRPEIVPSHFRTELAYSA